MVRVSAVCWSCDVRGSIVVGLISCTAYQGEVLCGSCDAHVTQGGAHVIRCNRAVVAYSRDALQCIGGGREPVTSGRRGPVRSVGERCDDAD